MKGLLFTIVILAGINVAAQDLSVLPLVEGNQWALSNPFTRLPAYVTVTKNDVLGGKRFARMRIDTPFSSTTLILSVDGDTIWFEGIATGEGRSYFDDALPLFSDMSKTGEIWENEVGRVTVIDGDEAVFTPSAIYEHCKHYRLELANDVTQHWYLAPGVGVVRLGNDGNTFVLNAYNVQSYTPPDRQSRRGDCPLVGIAPNPPANGSFTVEAFEKRLEEALEPGGSFYHLSATWRELEPKPGEYNLELLRPWIQWAEKYDYQIALTIKTVDTRVLSWPSDLTDRKLDDPEVIDRFRRLIAQVSGELTNRIRWIDLANEVDTYFLYNPHQLKAFQRFYAAGKDEVKSSWPDVSVGVVFAFNDFRVSDSVFRALVPNCDHVSFTYYPIRTNMRPRKPAVARSDIAEMVEAAGDKKLILTEIGYPSAESLGSSVDLQNEFYRNAFDALQAQPNRIAGAAFFLMSDIPTDVVTVLTEYYHLSSDEAFTTFLATLGVHDLQGAEKPAWRMFADRTKQLRELEACVAE